ncbi:hypothetical protein GCM10025876_08660 [Demequina litorisediminis]|uniref:Sodium/calcium exchanger membrane region domain-containing protein n=1 Tax=Demequina litorisediminis TaxID=1849022 RepID=A0ABQ6I9X9_9MICO|nr:hypothetical protein GCM10025876_08660 [Demequina litorisediminis]
MLVPIIATLVGLVVLAWSADRFVLGASTVARYLGMAPLLIGMIVIGFGTSAPELVVSAFAAAEGAPEIALGNAFGSNIANIGLILGVTAILLPIVVKRGVLRTELPLLVVVTAIAWLLMSDGELSSGDAGAMLLLLAVLLTWQILQARSQQGDRLEQDVEHHAADHPLSRRAAWTWLVVGLVILVVASRVLVWGATEIATALGWSDLVIGLTVVAVGTSAPGSRPRLRPPVRARTTSRSATSSARTCSTRWAWWEWRDSFSPRRSPQTSSTATCRSSWRSPCC